MHIFTLISIHLTSRQIQLNISVRVSAGVSCISTYYVYFTTDTYLDFVQCVCISNVDMNRCLAKCFFVSGWLCGLLYLAGQAYAPQCVL